MISRIENGRVYSIHLPSLERLAKALGCDPGYLIVKKEQ
jgi:DNA-binding Xre family transcriptional regulator